MRIGDWVEKRKKLMFPQKARLQSEPKPYWISMKTGRKKEQCTASPQEKLMLQLHHIRQSCREIVFANSSAHWTSTCNPKSLFSFPSPPPASMPYHAQQDRHWDGPYRQQRYPPEQKDFSLSMPLAFWLPNEWMHFLLRSQGQMYPASLRRARYPFLHHASFSYSLSWPSWKSTTKLPVTLVH